MKRISASIYIVEISCQLLDVLLELIRCLQAILEETRRKQRDTWAPVTLTFFGRNVRKKGCHLVAITALQMSGVMKCSCGHCEGHAGEGRESERELDWCSLCLMYSSSRRGTSSFFGARIWAGHIHGRFAELLSTSWNPLWICQWYTPQCRPATTNHR